MAIPQMSAPSCSIASARSRSNLVATAIFLLAIVHTFLAPRILGLSHRIQHAYEDRLREIHGPDLKEKIPRRQRQSIPAAVLHFFGEVEAVFGIWVIPLALFMWADKGPDVARHYLDQDVSYVEPLFVVIIMTIAASRPIVQGRPCACWGWPRDNPRRAGGPSC